MCLSQGEEKLMTMKAGKPLLLSNPWFLKGCLFNTNVSSYPFSLPPYQYATENFASCYCYECYN